MGVSGSAAERCCYRRWLSASSTGGPTCEAPRRQVGGGWYRRTAKRRSGRQGGWGRDGGKELRSAVLRSSRSAVTISPDERVGGDDRPWGWSREARRSVRGAERSRARERWVGRRRVAGGSGRVISVWWRWSAEEAALCAELSGTCGTADPRAQLCAHTQLHRSAEVLSLIVLR